MGPGRCRPRAHSASRAASQNLGELQRSSAPKTGHHSPLRASHHIYTQYVLSVHYDGCVRVHLATRYLRANFTLGTGIGASRGREEDSRESPVPSRGIGGRASIGTNKIVWRLRGGVRECGWLAISQDFLGTRPLMRGFGYTTVAVGRRPSMEGLEITNTFNTFKAIHSRHIQIRR